MARHESPASEGRSAEAIADSEDLSARPMSRDIRSPLASSEAIGLEPAPFPRTTDAEPHETGFADWRDRLNRNLSRRSDGRWEPLTRVHRARFVTAEASMDDNATARLPAFIRDHTDEILREWEAFARTLATETPMDTAALRDHAKEMLGVVAADLDVPQTTREQADKARRKTRRALGRTPTAAQQHGAGRALSGFSVEQMVSEFRALRASVLHLWKREQGEANADDLQDLIRFNESLDQAIAESITTYAQGVRQSRDRFLAVLGHDLRTPIGGIMTSTKFLLDLGDLHEPYLSLVGRMHTSARRMNRLVGDLIELARTRMGDSIPMVRASTDMRELLQDVVDEASASYPTHPVEIQANGDLRGQWDRERLMQALVNLVSNAVHHGEADGAITIVASGAVDEAIIAVHNHGAPIQVGQMDHLFDAMKEIQPGSMRDRRHLGLGLYIVDKIVAAHEGRIEVQSSVASGTTFTIHLPREGIANAPLNARGASSPTLLRLVVPSQTSSKRPRYDELEARPRRVSARLASTNAGLLPNAAARNSNRAAHAFDGGAPRHLSAATAPLFANSRNASAESLKQPAASRHDSRHAGRRTRHRESDAASAAMLMHFIPRCAAQPRNRAVHAPDTRAHDGQMMRARMLPRPPLMELRNECPYPRAVLVNEADHHPHRAARSSPRMSSCCPRSTLHRRLSARATSKE